MGKITNIFIGITLLLCFVMPVYAADQVQYELVNPYEQSSGTTLVSFSDVDNFTTNGTIEQSLISFDGDGAISLTTVGDVSYMETTIPATDLSSTDIIAVWIYVPDPTTLDRVSIDISSVTDHSKYLNRLCRIGNYGFYRAGWNAFSIDTSRFTSVNGESWENDVVYVRVNVHPIAGQTTTVIWDRISYDYKAEPVVIFSFDDHKPSVYDLAYPIMDARGIPGVSYVITDRVGTAQSSTIAQLREMQSSGWDISSHGKSHIDLRTLSTADLHTELKVSQDWLINNGFGEGSYQVAYPGGFYNDAVLNAVDDYYLLGRSTRESTDDIHIQNMPTETHLLKVGYVLPATTTAKVQEWIDSTIAHDGMLILLFHDISETGSGGEYGYSVANFTTICDYVAASDITPVVLSSYIAPVLEHGQTITGDTVTVYANGTGDRVTQNNFPGTYSDLKVVPSIDSVNVTVDSWSATEKVWTLSSETQQSVTHTIGGFPASTDIDIYRDGIDYATVRSNSTGYITWVYDGGFSEHTFEAIPHATAGTRDSFVSSWENTVSMIGVIILVSLAGSIIMVIRGKKDMSDIMTDMQGIIMVVVLVVIGAIIFGQF